MEKTLPQLYVPSFAARSANSGNPFGSTKFYGIYQTAGTLYLVFYADDAGVYFQKELTLFHSYIDRSHIQNTGLIFMGGSVSDRRFHEVISGRAGTDIFFIAAYKDKPEVFQSRNALRIKNANLPRRRRRGVFAPAKQLQ